MKKLNFLAAFSGQLKVKAIAAFAVVLLACAWGKVDAQNFVFPPFVNEAEAMSLLNTEVQNLQVEVQNTDGPAQNLAGRKLYIASNVLNDLQGGTATLNASLNSKYAEVQNVLPRTYDLVVPSNNPAPSPDASSPAASVGNSQTATLYQFFVIEGNPSNPDVIYINDPALADLVDLLKQ